MQFYALLVGNIIFFGHLWISPFFAFEGAAVKIFLLVGSASLDVSHLAALVEHFWS